MRRIHILLVDDHAVVREGYRRLLEETPDFGVVGEAASGNEAIQRFAELSPDVVVMDISLPGMSGIEATRRMIGRCAQARILAFSMHEEAIFVRRAFAAGATGYITKACAPDVLIEAVRSVAQGRRYLSEDVTRTLAFAATIPDGATTTTLTAREFEVLRLLAVGLSPAQIAPRLGMTPKTVANHQSAIKTKLGTQSTAALVRLAINQGLVAMAPVGDGERR